MPPQVSVEGLARVDQRQRAVLPLQLRDPGLVTGHCAGGPLWPLITPQPPSCCDAVSYLLRCRHRPGPQHCLHLAFFPFFFFFCSAVWELHLIGCFKWLGVSPSCDWSISGRLLCLPVKPSSLFSLAAYETLEFPEIIHLNPAVSYCECSLSNTVLTSAVLEYPLVCFLIWLITKPCTKRAWLQQCHQPNDLESFLMYSV